MSTINARNPRTDLTVQIFDKFYGYQQSIPSQEYDAVYSYLRSVFNTAGQAGNFTVTLFRMAAASNIPPMTLLQQLQGQSAPQITLTFAYYLNTFQSPATMLGIQVPTLPNFYVAHNIRQ
jgi:hypothetical protein